MSEKEPQFTLVPLGKEEGKEIVAGLQEYLTEKGIDLVVSPIINSNGTVGAKVEVFRKVELVEKSVPSPFLNGEEGKTEEN